MLIEKKNSSKHKFDLVEGFGPTVDGTEFKESHHIILF